MLQNDHPAPCRSKFCIICSDFLQKLERVHQRHKGVRRPPQRMKISNIGGRGENRYRSLPIHSMPFSPERAPGWMRSKALNGSDQRRRQHTATPAFAVIQKRPAPTSVHAHFSNRSYQFPAGLFQKTTQLHLSPQACLPTHRPRERRPVGPLKNLSRLKASSCTFAVRMASPRIMRCTCFYSAG